MYPNNLNRLRIKKYMTLQQLSSLTGLSSGYLSFLERGIKTNPSLTAMRKIADSLECEINEIF